VIITGGHGLGIMQGIGHRVQGTDHVIEQGSGLRAQGLTQEVVDLLFDGETFYEFRTPRIVVARGTHGTGCTFASAVAAGLVLGHALPDAAGNAQRYVAGAIAHALAIGHGHALLDHFWERRPRT
jgi:hydroxymethylpyrimidine/phosphomethylpyrimidine kinase